MRLVTVSLAIGSLVAKVVMGAWMPDRPALKATFRKAPDWAVPCWPVDLKVAYSWPPRVSITPEAFDHFASNGRNASTACQSPGTRPDDDANAEFRPPGR